MTPRELVKWNPSIAIDFRGIAVPTPLPALIAIEYRGTLLFRIFEMRTAAPITLQRALDLMEDAQEIAFKSGKLGDSPNEYTWYMTHFVEYIASLGCHIELTGNEFETLSDNSNSS